MKHILIIFTALLIISCSKDDEITKSKGTKLVSIAYFSEHHNGEENYFYDSNNMLYKIENFRMDLRIENSRGLRGRYEIEYNTNGKPLQYTTYRGDNRKVFRDSIQYNSNGDIDKIYRFSINSGENLPLTWIYEFEYDDSGKLAKKSTYHKRTERYTESIRYYWNGDNIEKTETYYGSRLVEESFFTYDDKVNYARNILIPIHIPSFISSYWNENNIIGWSWTDSRVNVTRGPLSCNPCEWTYTYNSDNLPVRIESNSIRLELRYELPPRDIEK